MALLDQNGETEFPYKKDDVFDAICRAVPIITGLKLDSADKITGRINVKGNISLWSWGETILIQLSTAADNKTRMQISSGSKIGSLGGIFDMGKNRKNVERILSGTSAILSQNTAAAAGVQGNATAQSAATASASSLSDELHKLKKLVDDGILTQEEFIQQKAKLLK